MADIVQTNLNLLRVMLEERRGYAGVDELLAWMRTDACDHGAWPKPMRESLCKITIDFRDYLASPMVNAMRDIMQTGRPRKDTLASLRQRMKRCAWDPSTGG